MWREQLAGLADVRHCIAIDLPADGRPDLASLIESLGDSRADLVGHSWGGHELLAAWRRSPACIRSIALLGVMFSADSPHAAPNASRPVAIEDQEGVVRSITVPLLVATGDADINTPPDLCRKLAGANPGARWVEIAGAGHMSPVEQPGQVNAALRALWYDSVALERRSTQRDTEEA